LPPRRGAAKVSKGAADSPRKELALAAGRKGPSQAVGGGPGASTTNPFGAGLESALIRACDDRLSDLHWFRTDWQRGGALTGYGRFADGEKTVDIVAKLPVVPRELYWLRRLQPDEHDAGEITPRLLAGGDQLNGYDLAWVVMERLVHGPLGPMWRGAELDLLIDAAGRFYRAARNVPPDATIRQEDWPDILRRARRKLRDHDVADEQHWNKAIKALQRKLDDVLAAWNRRDATHWCHGDLHLANAMTRNHPPEGPAFLFDFAEVHLGHWVEDAVYLEHLFWGREDRLAGRKLVKAIADQRKAHGLKRSPDWPQLAHIRRALLAAACPAYLGHQGDPIHLAGALNVLDRTLSQLKT
jgi:hypothetical protein